MCLLTSLSARYRGLPRLRGVVMGSFREVSVFVETGGTTGRSNCPKADRLYIFGTEAELLGLVSEGMGPTCLLCSIDEILPRF